GPVDHYRAVGEVVGARVFESKSLGAGEIVVELHRAELPFAADAVGHHKVDFRPVERRFAWLRFAPGEVHLLRDLGYRRLGTLPLFGGANVFVALRVAEAEPSTVVLHTERLEDFEGEVDAATDLVGYLRLGAEDVGVVLGEAS